MLPPMTAKTSNTTPTRRYETAVHLEDGFSFFAQAPCTFFDSGSTAGSLVEGIAAGNRVARF